MLNPKDVIFILGSGGHTAEMIRLMENFNFKKYRIITFVRSEGDIGSELKVKKLIANKKVNHVNSHYNNN